MQTHQLVENSQLIYNVAIPAQQAYDYTCRIFTKFALQPYFFFLYAALRAALLLLCFFFISVKTARIA